MPLSQGPGKVLKIHSKRVEKQIKDVQDKSDELRTQVFLNLC